LTFFEKELHRLFDDSECISADAVFAGKTMIAPIGEDLRAKVQFVYTNTHAKYDALRLTIINRHEGTVDSETFKFKDILGMKGDREPHIWEDGQRVDWYIYHPTAYDYKVHSFHFH
jgi:hypothetical protein